MVNTLKYKDYIATVHYSSDDEIFFGKVIGINDLITFEGSSVEDLKNNFKDAINDYLEICKELNKSPNKTYKGVFNVRVPSSLHQEVALSASQYQMTLNDFVKTALTYAVNHKSEVIADLSR